ncbi:lantibiotic dehydratase family protein [Flavobacterium difficile]|uniref:Lantibiotic dehydratase N-terminal domain-containing protein n=1 Tax=Flavobacterium difficile TaxID=2709659 RepID=A0ABX0I442_9FLAO|nr:lantibiotic dehydratase family protein [Flavobacterium difficile]NHM00522.1 hypothetical protein [Flavobacterium difficile]
MKPNSINCFDTFVLRTPLYPIHFYTNLLNEYSTEKLLNAYREKFVKEAIQIASPELISQFDKLIKNPEGFSTNKKIKLELALLKYIARLSSRATPFGIFAGCTTGKLTNTTTIALDAIEKHEVYTQFDMQYWINLLQDISKKKEILKELVYYPNSSLYKIANFYRYIEYQHVNKKREHKLSSFKSNEILETIINATKLGLHFNEILNLIIKDETEISEAEEFLLELIDNQILVNEIDACVTGDLESKRVMTILDKISNFTVEYGILEEISSQIEKRCLITNSATTFLNVKNLIEKFETPFEEKYILQTDLYKKTKTSTLNKNISNKVTKALKFLSKIRKNRENSNLTEFKKTFQRRYETREMPLSIVLDSELGIGYLQNNYSNDSHPILDSFSFQNINDTIILSENWTKIDYILEKKLKKAISNSDSEIILTEKDFDFNESEIQNIPDTFSVLIEVILENENEIISIESSGNYSAAKLIGRFCNGDEAIHNLAKEIVQKETTLNSNKILAEIVHLPQSRTGNILRRPNLRTYEIPYLANSLVAKKNQINSEDLYLSIKNNAVVLTSKAFQKEIIPCLSNAHNYSHNSIPVYHFLSDLQGQTKQLLPSFSWGILENHYNYFPRVSYSNVIISKAKWIIEYKEVERFTKINDIKKAFPDFITWKNNKKMPKYVNIVNGDNTLLIDIELEIGFTIFLNSIKPKSKIILEEFLFANNSPVKDVDNNSFANQFILSFYQSKNE